MVQMLRGNTTAAQIRPTVLLADQVPAVAVPFGDLIQHANGVLEMRPTERRLLPDELFLVAATVDPEDREAVAAFCGEHGMLTGSERGIPTGTHFSDLPASAYDIEVGHAEVNAVFDATEDSEQIADPAHWEVAHWQRQALRLKVLQALVRHWDAYVSDERDDELVAAWAAVPGSPLHRSPAGGRAIPPKEPSEAWWLFGEYLNAAVAGFNVRFTLDGSSPWTATTYTAMCLQLAHHIRIGALWRHCQNETCNRLFFRQEGRTVTGKAHADSMYCHRKCARAQAERERRRRLRSGD